MKFYATSDPVQSMEMEVEWQVRLKWERNVSIIRWTGFSLQHVRCQTRIRNVTEPSHGQEWPALRSLARAGNLGEADQLSEEE